MKIMHIIVATVDVWEILCFIYLSTRFHLSWQILRIEPAKNRIHVLITLQTKAIVEFHQNYYGHLLFNALMLISAQNISYLTLLRSTRNQFFVLFRFVLVSLFRVEARGCTGFLLFDVFQNCCEINSIHMTIRMNWYNFFFTLCGWRNWNGHKTSLSLNKIHCLNQNNQNESTTLIFLLDKQYFIKHICFFFCRIYNVHVYTS